ncbi:hypothetical protein, partial [Roseibium denhamense]|uniref:hypothetical protein n=1 Tax=Roseibium denhamense TaxID=76305 RepID=UPI0024B80ECB
QRPQASQDQRRLRFPSFKSKLSMNMKDLNLSPDPLPSTQSKPAILRTRKSPANPTDFLELRSQNPAASDVAAVDEPGYRPDNFQGQHRKWKKIKKGEINFISRE